MAGSAEKRWKYSRQFGVNSGREEVDVIDAMGVTKYVRWSSEANMRPSLALKRKLARKTFTA